MSAPPYADWGMMDGYGDAYSSSLFGTAQPPPQPQQQPHTQQQQQQQQQQGYDFGAGIYTNGFGQQTHPVFDYTTQDSGWMDGVSNGIDIFAASSSSIAGPSNPPQHVPPHQHPSLTNGYVFDEGMDETAWAPMGVDATSPSIISPGSNAPISPSAPKRPRLDHSDNEYEPTGETQESEEPEKATRLPGACQRCKTLKVKCEFKDPDMPCRRCHNGAHECVIPGRKKRRPPPKREHLLRQIRDQADEIQRLMDRLAAAEQSIQTLKSPSTEDKLSLAGTSIVGSPVPEGSVGVLSPTSPDAAKRRPEITSWLAKAQETIRDFSAQVGQSDLSFRASLNGFPFPEQLSSSAVQDEDEEVQWLQPSNKRKRHASASDAVSTDPSPINLFMQLSLEQERLLAAGGSITSLGVGPANSDFFKAGPSTNPAVLQAEGGKVEQSVIEREVVSLEESEELFRIYFEDMNLSISLLDPTLHTAQFIHGRSHFLFTTICAIAARHYRSRPDLYQSLMQSAHYSAGTAVISGLKSIETIQAFILLALYPVAARRWEEDRTFLYAGVAIRMATDLSLGVQHSLTPHSTPAQKQWEANRLRTWINCFCVDRSIASQFGKSTMIPNDDPLARACAEDGLLSKMEGSIRDFDIHYCAYPAELRVVDEFRTGMRKVKSGGEGDGRGLSEECARKLEELGAYWFERIERETDLSRPQARFRLGLLRLAYGYARLGVMSITMQQALQEGVFERSKEAANKCLDVAMDLVDVFDNELEDRYLRFGPDSQSVFITFAAAFLIRLLHPKYAPYLTPEKRQAIDGSVRAHIAKRRSLAVDEKHAHHLYALFLERLLTSPSAELSLPANAYNPPHGSSPSTTKKSPAVQHRNVQASSSASAAAAAATGSSGAVNGQVNGTSSSSIANALSAPQHARGPQMVPMSFDSDFLESMQVAIPKSNADAWYAMPGLGWLQSNPQYYASGTTTYPPTATTTHPHAHAGHGYEYGGGGVNPQYLAAVAPP